MRKKLSPFEKMSITEAELLEADEIDKMDQDEDALLGEIGGGELYPDLEPMDLNDVMVDDSWHPGKRDQRDKLCLAGAINLFVGGPLFDTREKFADFYSKRKHQYKAALWEHILLKGCSIKNFRYLIYLPIKDTWLSPVLTHVIENFVITTLFENKIRISAFLETLFEKRVIIQYVEYADFDDKTGEYIPPQSHAAVLLKDGRQIVLLDDSLEGPFNLT
jgi:hypothetical protein